MHCLIIQDVGKHRGLIRRVGVKIEIWGCIITTSLFNFLMNSIGKHREWEGCVVNYIDSQ